MSSPLAAILWAQWRVMWNVRIKGAVLGRVLAIGMGLVWYGFWAAFAVFAAIALPSVEAAPLRVVLPWALLGAFFYWQIAPVLTASLGTTLDLRKLLAYPIPEKSLFAIEVVLRLTTGGEVMLALVGAGVGLLRHPDVPFAAPLLAMPAYIAFNLFVAAGLRNLLERVFARKWLREAMIFVLVLATAVPQLVLYLDAAGPLSRGLARHSGTLWPWSAAADLALGRAPLFSAVLLGWWVLAAYFFGVRQFRRSLSFDVAAAAASPAPRSGRVRWTDRLYRLPSLVLADPLGALLEKELRTLMRTPRFRLVFVMGFSFGFLIWLPMFRDGGAVSENYPVFVAIYGLLLLAEVIVWNVFGFDRGAARLYFAAPVRFKQVMLAKNLATLAAVLFEIALISVVCLLLPFGIGWGKIVETVLVAGTIGLYLTGSGNLSSMYYPRPVNPEHSWGRSAGSRFQLFLLVLFPLMISPVLLAYGARYAFESDLAFYIALALAAAIGVVYYLVALDSALWAARKRLEEVLAALGESAGPLATE